MQPVQGQADVNKANGKLLCILNSVQSTATRTVSAVQHTHTAISDKVQNTQNRSNPENLQRKHQNHNNYS